MLDIPIQTPTQSADIATNARLTIIKTMPVVYATTTPTRGEKPVIIANVPANVAPFGD
jgi:hypothetical protein